LLIDQIKDKNKPVLDVGSGMGGLLNLLIAQGFPAMALTPNRSQASYIRSRHPGVELFEGKFEAIPFDNYRKHFGTIITSESFQYIHLLEGLSILEMMLAPGGRWILCDYFRTSTSSHRSGHQWKNFTEELSNKGWKIVSERDITTNVLPTISYAYMWGKRMAIPLVEFAVGKLKRKRPSIHYLLDDVIVEARAYLLDQLNIVNPEVFAREKKYMLLVMERKG
jgi:SAM-dependent methyltransferase